MVGSPLLAWTIGKTKQIKQAEARRDSNRLNTPIERLIRKELKRLIPTKRSPTGHVNGKGVALDKSNGTTRSAGTNLIDSRQPQKPNWLDLILSTAPPVDTSIARV